MGEHALKEDRQEGIKYDRRRGIKKESMHSIKRWKTLGKEKETKK